MQAQVLSRRDAIRARRHKRPSTITIPAHVSPHVKLVFTEMRRQEITYDSMEERSGVLRTTMKAWRHKNKPGLESIEAALGALGWDFVPVPREKVLPAELVADLGPVANKHKLSLAQTIEVLVALVALIHDRHPNEAPATSPALEDLAAA